MIVLCKSFPTLLNDESRTLAWEREVAGDDDTCRVVRGTGMVAGRCEFSLVPAWVPKDAIWVVGRNVGMVVAKPGCCSCRPLEDSAIPCTNGAWSGQQVFRRVIPLCESGNRYNRIT